MTPDDGVLQPRFRFVTDNMFEFGVRYNMDLQSLPRPGGNQSTEGTFLHSRIAMPHHPGTFASLAHCAPFECFCQLSDFSPWKLWAASNTPHPILFTTSESCDQKSAARLLIRFAVGRREWP